jgi:ArsR family transcriptional regulator
MNMRAPIALKDTSDPLSALCKAGGDALRLNVLRALSHDSFGVLELSQIFAIGQSGMSHHLKVLAQAGLVATRREGNAIFYRRALPQPERLGGTLHAALLDEVDQLELPDPVQAGIACVQEQRAAASREFFSKMAQKFQAQQDLIAGLSQYGDSVLALIETLPWPADATALEIGPGDGSFLPDLAKRFQRVRAVDNNPAMLELARQRCIDRGLENVTLALADVLDVQQPQADCVIVNMVLHHFEHPESAIHRLSSFVAPGGCLVVTELCSHDQSWAREACGDIWLGFEQDDLARWAEAAALTPGESLYIGLRNGFQIQVRHFAKPAEDRLTHR